MGDPAGRIDVTPSGPQRAWGRLLKNIVIADALVLFDGKEPDGYEEGSKWNGHVPVALEWYPRSGTLEEPTDGQVSGEVWQMKLARYGIKRYEWGAAQLFKEAAAAWLGGYWRHNGVSIMVLHEQGPRPWGPPMNQRADSSTMQLCDLESILAAQGGGKAEDEVWPKTYEMVIMKDRQILPGDPYDITVSVDGPTRRMTGIVHGLAKVKMVNLSKHWDCGYSLDQDTGRIIKMISSTPPPEYPPGTALAGAQESLHGANEASQQAASHKSRKDRPSKQASQRRASSKKRPEDSTHLSPTQQPDEKAQPPSSENSDKTVQEQAAAAQGGAPGSDERREKAAGSDAGSPSTKKSTQYYRKQARKQGIKFQGRPDGDLKAMRCFVCDDKEATEENPMMKCSAGCGWGGHIVCLKREEVPAGSWFCCQGCKEDAKLLKQLRKKEKDPASVGSKRAREEPAEADPSPDAAVEGSRHGKRSRSDAQQQPASPAGEADAEGPTQVTPKRRGRPPKSPRPDSAAQMEEAAAVLGKLSAQGSMSPGSLQEQLQQKQGGSSPAHAGRPAPAPAADPTPLRRSQRPHVPVARSPEPSPAPAAAAQNADGGKPVVKKRRGRPPKAKPTDAGTQATGAKPAAAAPKKHRGKRSKRAKADVGRYVAEEHAPSQADEAEEQPLAPSATQDSVHSAGNNTSALPLHHGQQQQQQQQQKQQSQGQPPVHKQSQLALQQQQPPSVPAQAAGTEAAAVPPAPPPGQRAVLPLPELSGGVVTLKDKQSVVAGLTRLLRSLGYPSAATALPAAFIALSPAQEANFFALNYTVLVELWQEGDVKGVLECLQPLQLELS